MAATIFPLTLVKNPRKLVPGTVASLVRADCAKRVPIRAGNDTRPVRQHRQLRAQLERADIRDPTTTFPRTHRPPSAIVDDRVLGILDNDKSFEVLGRRTIS